MIICGWVKGRKVANRGGDYKDFQKKKLKKLGLYFFFKNCFKKVRK